MAGSQGLTRTQQKKLESEIRRLIGKNYSDYQIMIKLNLAQNVFNEYKRKIVEKDKIFYEGLEGHQVFSDYVMRMNMLVEELDEVVATSSTTNALGAKVSAISKKKDIFESVVKMAQELGFVDKSSKKVEISGNFHFQNKSASDVEKEVRAEIKKITKLVNGSSMNYRPEIIEVIDESGQLSQSLPGKKVKDEE